jgi:hypothetical protein
MKIDKLITIIQNSYKDALKAVQEQTDASEIKYFLKDSLLQHNNKIEKYEKLSMSEEATKRLVDSYNSECSELNQKLNSFTLANRDAVNSVNSQIYIDSVKEFSEQGGKGFYDIGSLVSVKYDMEVPKFKKEIEKLIESGLDILILKEKNTGNADMCSYSSSAQFSLVMPSSAYSAYESMMVKEFPEHTFETHNTAKRENHFIPPLLAQRNQIKDLLKYSLNTDDVDRYNFTSLGYSSIVMDTKGGYGVFDSYRPDLKALDETVNQSLSCAYMYKKEGDHVNGMMPTLICYDKEESEILGLDPEKKNRVNITDDIAYLSLQQPKQDKNLTSKKSIKP